MEGIIDSHAHYFDKKFDTLEGGAHAILTADDFTDSVGWIVNVGTNPETNRRCIEQTARYENMWCAIGIHPEDCQHLDALPDAVLGELYNQLSDPEIRRRDKIVAIGEIGFDYYWQPVNKELQYEYFSRQMQMARELDLPVVIHDRDSHEDVIDMIKRHKGVRGVLHSFSGSAEMAKEIVRLGFMVSFSGTVSFKNARRPKEAAAVVPKDMLLIETDAPYLAPHPKRGTLNHSGNLVYTNAALAEAIGISPEECAIITEENARRFFSLK